METKSFSLFGRKITKKYLWIITTVWLIGISLTVLAATDLFNQTMFQRKFVPVVLLSILSTVVVIYAHISYNSNSKKVN
ncbi:hypothetical protein LX97_01531 [Nonlabens dokdonensis]|jgi:uncharacterized membrane protein YhaH (DUF805 family)|uniref:Uncharacterized protein n=2 Tax=Nonlabens dokdonensis TaxID=328515 RepID=L7WEB3_NONDD|nr:hypothetical protein [Nonlabens dokdonensis]AGC77223.1 hypothetical protein DDD_2096 [Nonlabens dokdonensis DSW-6]PZX40760.1 hypothetical protein LX97_01531 [Nonlabens dokdonensis]